MALILLRYALPFAMYNDGSTESNTTLKDVLRRICNVEVYL